MPRGGESLLGTHPQYFPLETAEAVKNATLIIVKGLASYESPTEYDLGKLTVFLLMVKCHAVARFVGVKKGDLVAMLRE